MNHLELLKHAMRPVEVQAELVYSETEDFEQSLLKAARELKTTTKTKAYAIKIFFEAHSDTHKVYLSKTSENVIESCPRISWGEKFEMPLLNKKYGPVMNIVGREFKTFGVMPGPLEIDLLSLSSASISKTTFSSQSSSHKNSWHLG